LFVVAEAYKIYRLTSYSEKKMTKLYRFCINDSYIPSVSISNYLSTRFDYIIGHRND